MRSELPGVSLGTIYRTLDILREIGLVQVFSHGGGASRYEAALEKHHHLVCTQCRELTNVQAAALSQIAHDIAKDAGFTGIDYSLTIVGRCADCSAN